MSERFVYDAGDGYSITALMRGDEVRLAAKDEVRSIYMDLSPGEAARLRDWLTAALARPVDADEPELGDLVARIRARPNDAPMPTERLLDEAADAIERFTALPSRQRVSS